MGYSPWGRQELDSTEQVNNNSKFTPRENGNDMASGALALLSNPLRRTSVAGMEKAVLFPGYLGF